LREARNEHPRQLVDVDVTEFPGQTDVRAVGEERARSERRLDPDEVASRATDGRPLDQQLVGCSVQDTRLGYSRRRSLGHRRLGGEDLAPPRPHVEPVCRTPLERRTRQRESIQAGTPSVSTELIVLARRQRRTTWRRQLDERARFRDPLIVDCRIGLIDRRPDDPDQSSTRSLEHDHLRLRARAQDTMHRNLRLRRRNRDLLDLACGEEQESHHGASFKIQL
jgi:hypothetical protein